MILFQQHLEIEFVHLMEKNIHYLSTRLTEVQRFLNAKERELATEETKTIAELERFETIYEYSNSINSFRFMQMQHRNALKFKLQIAQKEIALLKLKCLFFNFLFFCISHHFFFLPSFSDSMIEEKQQLIKQRKFDGLILEQGPDVLFQSFFRDFDNNFAIGDIKEFISEMKAELRAIENILSLRRRAATAVGSQKSSSGGEAVIAQIKDKELLKKYVASLMQPGTIENQFFANFVSKCKEQQLRIKIAKEKARMIEKSLSKSAEEEVEFHPLAQKDSSEMEIHVAEVKRIVDDFDYIGRGIPEFISDLANHILDSHSADIADMLSEDEITEIAERIVFQELHDVCLEHLEDEAMDEVFDQKCKEFASFGPKQLLVKEEYAHDPSHYDGAIAQVKTLGEISCPRDKLTKVFDIAKIIFDSMAEAARKFHQMREEENSVGDKKEDQPKGLKSDPEEGGGGGGPIHAIASDEFLPVLIFVVIRAGFKQRLCSQVEFINRYATRDQLMGELGYYVTSLESALLYIKRLSKDQLLKDKQHHDKANSSKKKKQETQQQQQKQQEIQEAEIQRKETQQQEEAQEEEIQRKEAQQKQQQIQREEIQQE